MKILYFQYVDDSFKFIYKTSSGKYKTASGTNFSGMEDLLIMHSGAVRLLQETNIYEHCSMLNKVQGITEKF
jgi:hypothetical protein